APEADWDTEAESPNQKARRLARDEVLRWLDFKLGPAATLSLAPDPGHPATHVEAAWPTRPRLAYRLERSESIENASWNPARDWTDGTGAPDTFAEALPPSGR